MKRNILKAAFFIACISLFSCSSDDSGTSISDFINTPNTQTASRVTAIKHSGYFDRVFDWTFKYSNSGLKEAKRTVQKGDATQTTGDEISYSLAYGSKEIKIKSTDKPITVKVKSDGLLETFECGNTKNAYYYSDGRLIGYDSKFTLSGAADNVVKGARSIIEWENGNIKSIEYTPSTDAENKKFTYTFEYYDDQKNANGIMPELVSAAMGCEGVEFLYYSGLLGKGTENLVKTITVTHSTDESLNNLYTFYYRTENGNIVFSNYQSEMAEGGQPVVITYKY